MCGEDEFNHFLIVNVYVQNSGKHGVWQNIIIGEESGGLYLIFCKYTPEQH